MRQLTLALAAMLTASTAHAAECLHFELRPQAGSAVQVRIDRNDTGGKHQSNWSQSIPLEDLPGLDRTVLDRRGPVTFRLTRPAGTLYCHGLAHDRHADGDCDLSANRSFVEELAARGLGRPNDDQTFQLTMSGVSLDVLDALRTESWQQPTLKELVELGIFHVTAPSIHGLAKAGYRGGSVQSLVQFAIFKVTPEFIGQMRAAGLDRLSAETLVQLRIFNVTPDDVRTFASNGKASSPRHSSSSSGWSALCPGARKPVTEATMPATARARSSILALAVALAGAGVAEAQDRPPTASQAATAPATVQTFTPADFTRFAPKTGYDMLTQVPGFTIRSADTTRGLGQASENVLVNGQRVIDKAGGATALLQKVPAGDVIRIEISEAASLGIAGLTGQVANVILKADRKGSGNYSWSPQWRAHFAKPRWLKGAISYSGSAGDLGYTVSLEDQPGRGALGGSDYRILSPSGTLVERRDQVLWNSYDDAKLTAVLKYGAKGPVQANLTLDYDPYWQRGNNFQRRIRLDGNSNDWNTHTHDYGFQYDVSGDVSVPLGAGRLKLIWLRHFQHDPTTIDQRTDYDSGAPSDGIRYGLDQRIGETVGRLEYHWKCAHNDWTLSFERARNSLAQVSTLASLQPGGGYVAIPFPQGTGTVVETRYEGLASLSRSLSPKLDVQLAAGAETSKLGEVAEDTRPRQFFRPKGSATLAWRPAAGWDVSLKLERRVGQISFSDFLANQDVTNNRANDANPDLVPPQSWEVTTELGRTFGRWGKTRLKLYRYSIDDIVDHIPVGIDGDAVGNLPHATRIGLESISTIQFDPLGWRGAKLDADIGFERSRVRDPLTGSDRAISNTRDRFAELTLRHDVPHTQFAWGGGLSYEHYGFAYYLDEVNQNWEGPYSSVFVELKSFHGLKVHGEVFNLNNGRVRSYRDVYTGRRTAAPISFLERQHQLVGPLISLTVSGNF